MPREEGLGHLQRNPRFIGLRDVLKHVDTVYRMQTTALTTARVRLCQEAQLQVKDSDIPKQRTQALGTDTSNGGRYTKGQGRRHLRPMHEMEVPNAAPSAVCDCRPGHDVKGAPGVNTRLCSDNSGQQSCLARAPPD